MAEDATLSGGGSGNRQSDGQQPAVPEPGLIDRVSNALDSAEQTLEAPSRWFDAQAERAANSAMESIAEHLNPPPDLMVPPLGPPPALSFGAGETPAVPEPGLIDRVSNALDSAEQTLEAPSRWFDAQAERATNSAMESIAEHFNPPPEVMIPPLGPPPALSFGTGETPLGPPPAPSFGTGETPLGPPPAPSFGAGEAHPLPAPASTDNLNLSVPPAGTAGGIDLGGGDGLTSALGDLPATSSAIFDHVPDDTASGSDAFGGVGTGTPTHLSLDPAGMGTPSPAPEPMTAPPAPEPNRAPPEMTC